MIAPANIKLLHRRGDFGDHVGLLLGKQDAVAVDDVADGGLSDGGHLDRGGRLGLLGLLFGAGRQQKEKRGRQE